MTNRNGIAVAVLDGTDTRIMTFGAATKNQLFEIGSITKTFTANLLAQSILAGSLRLSDSIPDAYQKPGALITYQHLTTHTSGITGGLFPDFRVTNPLFPFEGLTIPVFKTLYSKTPLVSKPGESWSYSNLGASLLGLILSENTGSSYEDLVKRTIFAPLAMTGSYFQVPENELGRFSQGSIIIDNNPAAAVPRWDLYATALSPAGGIRSTIDDMVKYARANLIPESTPLAETVKLSQKPLFSVSPELSIGMNWLIDLESDVVWHNGATGGFNSVIALSKKRNQAIIAMSDTAIYVTGPQGALSIEPSFQNIALGCLK
ncbi:serine hydrolase domain-containing protein [Bdellovibrionota bacterium FG-1]